MISWCLEAELAYLRAEGCSSETYCHIAWCLLLGTTLGKGDGCPLLVAIN
jgi:hypothetical protein